MDEFEIYIANIVDKNRNIVCITGKGSLPDINNKYSSVIAELIIRMPQIAIAFAKAVKRIEILKLLIETA